ncbi:hypothetical protein [Comamonas thiooxydans]|uniref:hypothetical protein n=1 Tax=Comamonas thiooxydans TaxID=363952 RepID=UPI000B0C2654|nr:hypothetical protein [Comamonas thiooxydans]
MTQSEMHRGNVIEYWYELHKRQSDWAFRAYGRLIQTLSEDVQEKLSLKDEAAQPYVVIFGKTQVGKTTLLLDLMGIAPEQMPIISEVMRGGREQGKSATATAMEYRASMSECWGLTIPGESVPHFLDSDQKMKRALWQIREEMESGQLVGETPCVVHIPKRFFDTASSSATNVRILDLPGDNPANEQEQKHVNQMAKTYLPFADLVLLVGRGDDLGFLKPEVITLPGIEDWQAMPHRFRIVTTYSYTAQSVKDILRNDDAADEAVLRRRLIQEIERFGVLNEAARNEALYFPLEFGNSWTGVQATEPELHQRMSPIITRLRAELLNQITKATTPIGRLRSTLNTHHSVKYIQKKKMEVIEIKIQGLASKGTEIAQELATWDKSVEQAGVKLSKVKDVLASQDLCANQFLIKSAASRPIYTTALKFPPELRGPVDDVATLKKLVFDYYQILPTLQLEISSPNQSIVSRPYWVKIQKSLVVAESRFVHDLLDEKFSSIRNTLSDYWIDTYFSSDNYKKDLRLVHDAGNAAQEALAANRMNAWLSALGKVHGEYLTDQRAIQNDLAVRTDERDISRQRQIRVEEKLRTLHAELEHVKQRSAEDLERCERFDHLLDEEYLSELSERMATVQDAASDDCDVLLQLLSCVELTHQREELMQLKKQSTF